MENEVLVKRLKVIEQLSKALEESLVRLDSECQMDIQTLIDELVPDEISLTPVQSMRTDKYKLWLLNHQYFLPQTYATLNDAVVAAKSKCMDILVYLGNNLIATVEVIGGVKVMGQSECTPQEREELRQYDKSLTALQKKLDKLIEAKAFGTREYQLIDHQIATLSYHKFQITRKYLKPSAVKNNEKHKAN